MPPFLGQAHFYSALQNEALPTLERIAENDTMRNRSLNRFERDDPPPYASSTESEDFDDDFPIPQSNGRLPDELIAIMDPPLTDNEMSSIALTMQFDTNPDASYSREAKYEEARLRDYRPFLINPLFRGKYGLHRRCVLIRHYIKRRWEKLGIWNPEWGIPVRNNWDPQFGSPMPNEQPNGNMNRWRWRWEQASSDGPGPGGSEAVNAPYKGYEGKILVERALRLRQNLCRGDSSPVVPRSRLTRDATASEAGSFIISRPWFIYKLEKIEEGLRFWRLDPKYIHSIKHSAGNHVIEWWKERGDWREKFNLPNGYTLVNSWKWRHESPSPEPEDLTPIDNMKDSPLDSIDMDFTPSERDAFEAIPPLGYRSPKPPTPPGERFSIPYPDYAVPDIFGPPKPPPEDHQDASQEVGDHPLEPQQEPPSTPPQKTRCQRQRQLRDKGRDADQDQPSLPRRSPRIAGMKRSAELPPSEVVPNKKRKGKTIPRAAALETQPSTRETGRETTRDTRRHTKTLPAPAKSALKDEIESQPRRGRGRPRKKTKQNNATLKDETESQPRRGRPRKKTRQNDAALKDEIESQPRRGRGRPRKKTRQNNPAAKEMPAPFTQRKRRAIAADPPAAPRRRRRSGKNA